MLNLVQKSNLTALCFSFSYLTNKIHTVKYKAVMNFAEFSIISEKVCKLCSHVEHDQSSVNRGELQAGFMVNRV